VPEKRGARGTGSGAPVELATWLAACRERSESAIPANDPVFRYADQVGIGRDLIALCWREFKRRRQQSRKRQKDWRQTFRNCVEANWYGLWYLAAGEPARLSSKGEQAQRFFAANDEPAPPDEEQAA